MASDIVRSRPHTSLGHYRHPVYVDSDTKIAGDFVLTPGFKENLESFYPKASTEDKARCLELLTSLDIGEELKEEAKQYQKDIRAYEPPPYVDIHNTKRPKSAASYYNKTKADIMNPYTTSYTIHYPERIPSATQAERPPSHQRISHGSRNHVHYKHYGTTYQNQFRERIDPNQLPIHPESEPRNNPQPLPTFMTWKIPRNSCINDTANRDLREEMRDSDLYDKVIRGSLSTTYQEDYHHNHPNRKAPNLLQDYTRAQTPITYSLNSIQRHAFQNTPQPEELQLTNTRYGTNKNKGFAARGIVPGVPRKNNYVNIKTRTTYDRHFNETVQPKATEVRELARQHGVQSLQRQFYLAKDEDRAMISKMLNSMSDGQQQKPYRAFTPACTPISPPVPV